MIKTISIVLFLLIILPLVNALNLNISSPENKTYDSTSVLFNLSADNRSYFYYSNINDSGRWIKLCNEKSRVCEKKVRARGGVNNFEVKAVFGEESANQTVTFTVDSKKPKITKTFPRRGTITNGSLFSIWYSEENLKNITLYYGDNKTSKNNCESGMSKQCNFNLTYFDLFKYNGKEIEYWFNVSDEVNTVLSKKTKIEIDVSKPNVSVQYLQDGKKMKFVFDVVEKNFDRIFYKDESDCLPENEASGLLCSALRDGRCVVTKSFCEGSHNLTIIVTDEAGNSNETYHDFDVNGA